MSLWCHGARFDSSFSDGFSDDFSDDFSDGLFEVSPMISPMVALTVSPMVSSVVLLICLELIIRSKQFIWIRFLEICLRLIINLLDASLVHCGRHFS